MKTCIDCSVTFTNLEQDFFRTKQRKDGTWGYTKYCRTCRNLRQRKWADANPDRQRAYGVKSETKHRVKRLAKNKRYSERTKAERPEQWLHYRAKSRAKVTGLAFNITPEDIKIPEFCPLLGLPLVFTPGSRTDNSYSLDRIVPALGYVRGNILVISDRANRIKNDATLAELKLITRNLEALIGDPLF